MPLSNLGGLTFTVKDSHLNTYTQVVSEDDANGAGYSLIFDFQYATAPGSTTLTVTCSSTAGADCFIQPYTVTGQNTSQAGAAALGVNSGSSTSAVQVTLTTTQAGSVVTIVGECAASTPTAIAGTTQTSTWNDSAGAGNGAVAGVSTSPTGTPGATTFGWTVSPALTFGFGAAAAEILPAGAVAVAASTALPQPGSRNYRRRHRRAQTPVPFLVSAVVTASAVLSGDGTLSAAPALTSPASLSGSGTLSAAVTEQPAAALSGSGTLSASPALAYPAALSGSGTLSAAPVLAPAAALSGSGTLSAAPSLASAAALSGSGTLSAAPVLRYAAGLSGSGTLSAAASLAYTASLSGSGSLAGAPVLASAAALSGSGTLTATAVAGNAAVLSGSGTLSAAPVLKYTAGLSGSGSLTAAPVLKYTAALSGSGTLSAAASLRPAPVLSGSGSLTAAPVLRPAPALSGSGILSGAWTLRSAAALVGSGTLSAAGTLNIVITDSDSAACTTAGEGVMVTDNDQISGQDSGFYYASDSDTATMTESVQPFVFRDSDGASATERELTAWPRDSDTAGPVLEQEYWSGPLHDSDTGGLLSENVGPFHFADNDAGTGTEGQVIEVWTYQPPFRWQGGWYSVVYQGRTVWKGRTPERFAVHLAQQLEAGTMHVVWDEDGAVMTETETPVLLVTLVAEKALTVTLAVEIA
jgi:hypothetical protein